MIRSLVLVALLVSGIVAQAATTNFTVIGGTTNLALYGNLRISQICITAPSTADTFTFYDGPTNKNTYTNAAYASRTRYATNYTWVITNSVGILQTNHVNGVYTLTNTVAANTNLLPVIFSGASAVASAQTCASVNLIVTRGLVVGIPSGNTNTNTISVTYTRSF